MITKKYFWKFKPFGLFFINSKKHDRKGMPFEWLCRIGFVEIAKIKKGF